jgi:predicted transcriptional regulator
LAKQQQRNASERRSVRDLLKEQVQDLNAQISEVEAELQPIRDELDELHKQQFALREQEGELVQRIREIEAERLIPMRTELSMAARASGGIALSDGAANDQPQG